MRTVDFSPLFRSSIGFDRMTRLLDSAAAQGQQSSYPPYNIVKTDENEYELAVAVAGFSPENLTMTVQDGSLVIKGQSEDETEGRTFLHRGIANRAFERQFNLADDIKVGDARLEHGMLYVALEREIPESKRPRTISIRTGDETGRDTKTIEQKKAA